MLVVGIQFVTGGQTFLVLAELSELGIVSQFLPARLDRKIGLTIGDDSLTWITILDDQVSIDHYLLFGIDEPSTTLTLTRINRHHASVRFKWRSRWWKNTAFGL